jgi:hypothetical protein
LRNHCIQEDFAESYGSVSIITNIKTLPDEDPLSYVSMRTQFVIELENRKPTYYPWLRDNNYVPVFDTDGSTAFKDSLDAEEAQFEPDFAS